MKLKKDFKSNYTLWFVLIAFIIICGILFISPMVGVADQGDFDRVMGKSSLSLLDSDLNNPNFNRFYDYIVTDYQINYGLNTLLFPFGTSMGYLITFITFICKLLGQSIFKTQYLAIGYAILYVLALSLILKYLNVKDNFKRILLSILMVLVFLDGNYIIWFNSLYGEPMMIITLLLFIASVLGYIHYKYVLKSNEKITSKIALVIIAGLLFLGSKLQVSMTMPFILILVGKILFDNRKCISKGKFISLCLLASLLVLYPAEINLTSNSLSNDTQYNSVFYGVLNGSDTPEQDLIDLGLNPDMAVEAGKHAYLNDEDYVKYIPRTEITEKEFYNKISNGKLAKFYLTHPLRLIQGMEYTASKAFYTSTSLGKCLESYSKTPVTEFNRFTAWSNFRENKIPKSLIFIILIYLIVFIYSIYRYIKNKNNKVIKNRVYIIWLLILISGIQFPMPYVGNGQADTAKQLFLFNFIFDIFFVLIASIITSKIIDMVRSKLKK